MYSNMYLKKQTTKYILNNINKYFIYSQFIMIKHNNYPQLNNIYLTVNNVKFNKIYNIPVEKYTIKFPKNYDFSEDILSSIHDKYVSLDITKTIFLDVYNETNEFIGYYSQNIHIHNNNFIIDYRV